MQFNIGVTCQYQTERNDKRKWKSCANITIRTPPNSERVAYAAMHSIHFMCDLTAEQRIVLVQLAPMEWRAFASHAFDGVHAPTLSLYIYTPKNGRTHTYTCAEAAYIFGYGVCWFIEYYYVDLLLTRIVSLALFSSWLQSLHYSVSTTLGFLLPSPLFFFLCLCFFFIFLSLLYYASVLVYSTFENLLTAIRFVK